MTWLFGSTKIGWRWEPRQHQTRAERRNALENQLNMLNKLPPADTAQTANRRELLKSRVALALKEAGKRSWKRSPRALRRANPRSVGHVADKMRELCLSIAQQRKLDVTKSYWFNKAEMAAALQVPEHFIAQVVHQWNLKGICSQGENNGMHDSHRDRHWGGPWVSCWQDTRYTLRLDKLQTLTS